MNANVNPLHLKNDKTFYQFQNLFCEKPTEVFAQRGFENSMLKESLVLCYVLEDQLQKFQVSGSVVLLGMVVVTLFVGGFAVVLGKEMLGSTMVLKQ
ncbi:hypothetical protein DEO72_LG11g2573 [Vigna unguiculata]|uniref:Uncharacterized protein n=1 Tax=Vigna unguiculata TaxID=3917 RepID=A0A4D6NRG3_VIGUN|nr:hypothetical protein DEO72_LG11g2573 [Vigna unguiculata]